MVLRLVIELRGDKACYKLAGGESAEIERKFVESCLPEFVKHCSLVEFTFVLLEIFVMTQNIQKCFGFVIRMVACLLVISSFSLVSVQAATITWTGGAGAGNEQWSNFSNFSSAADPSGEDVVFGRDGEAGSAGVVTNIVDSSVTIGTLAFTHPYDFASTIYHTTQIDTGQTLTVTGSYVQGLGNPPCSNSGDCTGYNTNVTFTGDGTFAFDNAAGNFNVGQWSGNWNRGNRSDILDMSTLANFTMNANLWEIGRVGAATPSRMTLADTNVIAATTLDMGRWNDQVILELGRDTTLNVDTFNIGYNTVNSSSSTIQFDGGLVSPSVTIRDKSGSGAATLNMSRPSQSSFTSIINLAGGDVDALFDTVTMGVASAGASNSTITFEQGSIIADTIHMSIKGAAGYGNSTISINGTGALEANTVNMVDSNAGTGNSLARINLGGGSLRATNVQAGDSLGSGIYTREINFSSGTIGNISGSDSTISSDIALNILTTGTHTFDVTSGQTMTVNADIVGVGTGAVNKTGAGTLLMNGTNTYVAPTNVLAGTIGGTGSASSDFTVAAGSTLSPGASAGTFLADDASLQSGSVLYIEIGGTTAGSEYDQVVAGGDVNISGDLIVTFINGFTPSEDDVFTILSADSVTGQFNSVQLLGGNGSFGIAYFGNSIQLSNFQIPEPSTLTLLGFSMLGCQILRRKRRRAQFS